jgi:acyl-coenzyme A thioesterase PaaI-like protein
MEKQAFQDQIPDNFCYGCGPGNQQGLRLKSFWDGAESVATFQPQDFHTAGPRQFLNGGIIATIIDCHCVGTAIADAYRREGRSIGTEPHIWCATASLKVDYLRPAPIDRLVTLRAQVVETDKKKTRLSCSLLSEGRECARGEVLAIQVPTGWREQG